jgi:hypothetical protein
MALAYGPVPVVSCQKGEDFMKEERIQFRCGPGPSLAPTRAQDRFTQKIHKLILNAGKS